MKDNVKILLASIICLCFDILQASEIEYLDFGIKTKSVIRKSITNLGKETLTEFLFVLPTTEPKDNKFFSRKSLKHLHNLLVHHASVETLRMTGSAQEFILTAIKKSFNNKKTGCKLKINKEKLSFLEDISRINRKKLNKNINDIALSNISLYNHLTCVKDIASLIGKFIEDSTRTRVGSSTDYIFKNYLFHPIPDTFSLSKKAFGSESPSHIRWFNTFLLDNGRRDFQIYLENLIDITNLTLVENFINNIIVHKKAEKFFYLSGKNLRFKSMGVLEKFLEMIYNEPRIIYIGESYISAAKPLLLSCSKRKEFAKCWADLTNEIYRDCGYLVAPYECIEKDGITEAKPNIKPRNKIKLYIP